MARRARGLDEEEVSKSITRTGSNGPVNVRDGGACEFCWKLKNESPCPVETDGCYYIVTDMYIYKNKTQCSGAHEITTLEDEDVEEPIRKRELNSVQHPAFLKHLTAYGTQAVRYHLHDFFSLNRSFVFLSVNTAVATGLHVFTPSDSLEKINDCSSFMGCIQCGSLE